MKTEDKVSEPAEESSSRVTPKSSSSSSFEVDSTRLCTSDYGLCNRALSGDGIRSGAYKQFADKHDSKSERHCYENDESNCEEYGGLYQWAEMMQLPCECNTKSYANLIQENHQGISPDGRRLLTVDDFYIFLARI